MNILYLTNHLNIGGITTYVFTLARGLKERGHNIYIATSPGQSAQKFKDANVHYVDIPIKTKKEISPKIIASLIKLVQAAKEYDIDIVHSNSRTTQVLGCLLSRFSNIIHISTCHGFFRKRILRKVFPCWGQKVIAISKQVKQHLLQDFRVKENDIRIIYNGIDVDKFMVQTSKSVVQRKAGLGLGDGPVVGIVARLSDVKGHIYLIEAMKEVLKETPQAQLLIVGQGKLKGELVRFTQSLGISKSVFFMPEVENTMDVLPAMDLFVMPSLKEGLGLALMEAMALGLAVVASNIGGIKDLIQHNYNGILVEPANVKELASAIALLLDDSRKRESLGKEARVFIASNFSEGKMVLETERVYLECLSAGY